MKIAILTDKYLPIPLANGICISSLLPLFIENNHSVSLIYFNDPFKLYFPKINDNKVNYYSVNVSLRLILFYFLIDFPYSIITKLFTPFVYLYSKIVRILNYRIYPITSKLIVNNFFNKLLVINNIQTIDLLFSSSFSSSPSLLLLTSDRTVSSF